MELANKGYVKLSMEEYKLESANKALHDLNEGLVKGRAVLIPWRREKKGASGKIMLPDDVVLFS